MVFLLALLFYVVVGQDIILTIPHLPLSAVGLATPYKNNLNQTLFTNAAFVQGAWFDPNANTVAGYNPLVITAGTNPAIPPTPVNLPVGATVGLWFGCNGNTLTLMDTTNGADLGAGSCVNGVTNSIFGTFAYCNAPIFFSTINAAITNGVLHVPPLGTATDGQACPTTHDFFVVDTIQSGSVDTSYLITATQLVAQATITNMNNLGANVVGTLSNPGDVPLMSINLAAAFNCPQWNIRDMTDINIVIMNPTFPTVEMQATLFQQPPIALVPVTHGMTRINNQPTLSKTNAYRAGCGQPQATTVAQADGLTYCNNLYFTAPLRLFKNEAPFTDQTSPDMNVATNLYAFLAQRFTTTFGANGLGCLTLLNVAPPVVPVMNMGGLFVGATIIPPNVATTPTTGLPASTVIIIVVCTVVGSLLSITIVAGIIWYKRRLSFYA